MNLNKLYIFTIFWIVLAAPVFSQHETGSFTIVNYTPKDYTAHAQNWSSIQDDRGIMYFGNSYGVLEFDGNSWNIIKVTNESNVRSIDIDKIGRVFIGAKNEFGYLFPDSSGSMLYNSLSHLLPESEIPFDDLWQTLVINNIVYFQGKHHIISYNGTEVTSKYFENEINQAFVANKQLYLSFSKSGLYKFSNNEAILIQAKEEEFQILDHSFYNGINYLLYHNDGIYKIDANDSIELVTLINDENLASKANYFVVMDNHQIAIGTSGDGIFVINNQGNVSQKISVESKLQSPTVSSLMTDNHGVLWATLSNGISKIDINSPLSIIAKPNGLNSTVEDITRHKGILYLATNNGITYLTPCNDYNTSELPKMSFIKSISGQCWGINSFQTLTDTILLYVDNNGVHEVDKNGNPHLIADCYPWALIQSKHDPNRVFISLDPGLMSIYRRNGKWEVEMNTEHINIHARRISEDKDGVIWLSAEQDGIVKVEFDFSKEQLTINSTTAYTSKEGLPVGSTTVLNGEKWQLTGTYNGLYRYNSVKQSFVPDTIVGSLFDYSLGANAFVRLSEDHKGNIWLVALNEKNNTTHLSFVHPPSDMNDFVHKKSPFIELSEFTIFAIFHDKNNITWLGGPDGLFRYDGNHEKDYSIDFKVSMREVKFSNDSILYGGAGLNAIGSISTTQNTLSQPVIDYKRNSLTFEFSAHSYEDITTNLYSYQLEGFENNWTDWKPETKAIFTNLPEGDYTFKVKAINKYRHESEEMQYNFTILPPWYRTIWAYIAYFLGFIGIVKGAIEISSRRLKVIIEEKTAEVVKQKDEIEAKNANLENANEEILHQKHEIEEKNKDIVDSINYAEKIQRAILPQEEMRERILPNSFVLFRPKDIVSGDFYWMSQHGGKVLFTAADCTGHGVPGAFMSMIGTALLNETVNEQDNTVPSKILDYVKAGVIKSLKQGEYGESKDGMDVALCAIDFSKNILEYAGANNPLYVIRKSEVGGLFDHYGKELKIAPYLEEDGLNLYEVKADKMPLAYYPGCEGEVFTNNYIQLQDGDSIYVASDGFPDQFGGVKGKKFMYKKFKRLLMSLNSETMDKQNELLEKSILDWMGNEHEQIDDICIIGVKI